MAIPLRRQSLTLPLAPAAAGAAGLLVAATVLLIPTALLESLVVDSGLGTVVSAAVPPLGLKARAAVAFVAGGGVALVLWLGLFLLYGNRSLVVQRSGAAPLPGRAPSVRRADAHPDAPPRRPFSVLQDVAAAEPAPGDQPGDVPTWLKPAIIDRPASPNLAAASAPHDVRSADVPPRIEDAPARYVERGADRRRAGSHDPLPLSVPPSPPEQRPALPMGTPTPPEPVAECPAPVAIRALDGAAPPRPAGATIDQLIARLERGVERPAPSAPVDAVPEPAAPPKPLLPEIDTLEQTLETLRRLSRRVG